MPVRVFTRINGKLACWSVDANSSDFAIKLVREELGIAHRPAILALVKY